jgi:leader peptidase (prepilin peptidase) / N-methyltransferase
LTSLLLAFEQLPLWSVASLLAVLGAIWGSFVGALCVRWPAGESVLRGRSHCDYCKTLLRARELVPILSYLFQRGQCRHCNQSIGRALVGIELTCAGLGIICAILFPPAQALTAAAICWLLVPLIILDWRHYWLPDALLIWLGIGGLIVGGFLPQQLAITDRLIGGALGFALLELLRRGYAQLRGIDAMGAGDPKLFGALGLWLGWQALPLIMLAASLLGLADYMRRTLQGHRRDSPLPLGSYLSGAAMLWTFMAGSSWLTVSLR